MHSLDAFLPYELNGTHPTRRAQPPSPVARFRSNPNDTEECGPQPGLSVRFSIKGPNNISLPGLAVAQELATDKPQVLILNDVLVNTDHVGQDRVLDVLATQAARLQIRILTCHPDRYRGAGHSLSVISRHD